MLEYLSFAKILKKIVDVIIIIDKMGFVFRHPINYAKGEYTNEKSNRFIHGSVYEFGDVIRMQCGKRCSKGGITDNRAGCPGLYR